MTPRLLDRVVDGAVAVFGGWTIAYHLALAVGATRDAALVFGLGLATVAIGLSPRPARETTAPAAPSPPASIRSAVLRLAGVGVVAFLAATGSAAFWPAAFLLAVWLLVGAPRSTAWRDHRGDRPAAAAWIVAIAFGSAYLSAGLVQWTSDDSYYVNRALVIAESSGSMPYGVDTMHSAGGFPSAEPDNDLASWHGLAGVGADFSGMTPRGFISLIAQPLVAALAVLAVWRACGVLGAVRPALITAVVLALGYFLAGDGRSIWFHMWASNSGRSMLATVLVPLALVYSLEAARGPSARSGMRLALVCIAGAGASGAAGFVLPPVVLAGTLAARARPLVRPMRTVWVGAIAGLGYAATVTLIGLVATRDLPASGIPLGSVADQWTFGVVGIGAAPLVIGVVTGLLFLAAIVAPPAARRFSAFGLVLVLALVVSPLALEYGGKGGPTAFRGTWALVPMVLAAVALDGMVRRPQGALVAIAGFVVVGGFGVSLGDLGPGLRPASDLPPTAGPARALIAVAPTGATVVAPLPVLAVVPVLTTTVYPLIAQERYGAAIDTAEPAFRHAERIAVLAALGSGSFDGTPDQLGALIDDFGIGAVALAPRAQDQGWIIDLLRTMGFERRGRTGDLTLWGR